MISTNESKQELRVIGSGCIYERLKENRSLEEREPGSCMEIHWLKKDRSFEEREPGSCMEMYERVKEDRCSL